MNQRDLLWQQLVYAESYDRMVCPPQTSMIVHGRVVVSLIIPDDEQVPIFFL